jgi:glutamate synthase (NADPH/NADH) small chain
VVLFEKADRAGGLLRYGIPDFKLDKASSSGA